MLEKRLNNLIVTKTLLETTFSDGGYNNISIDKHGLHGMIGNHYEGGGFGRVTLEEFMEGKHDDIVSFFAIYSEGEDYKELHKELLLEMKEYAQQLINRYPSIKTK